ncbi:Acyl-CoA synthetase (AMP-forming)/AMP-acid ligase II [Geosmithia morbida]|uniref:Acyl-CoA synthetase (AMP-forming)/AMP-acid ligase II n=1 Tax=Geosmithia morbida TaxID=1094350 RepID=A0A9P5CYW1_9HYPO|nr:Acyl-CoA synthetase (AMP-forming)/AMP-acid ligase II [Geosmithia morbida]KAF4120888.1 Acyl-CoA synthetase (AMP-forming)/AMP-acid ligase II [Geosmithia morbida]
MASMTSPLPGLAAGLPAGPLSYSFGIRTQPAFSTVTEAFFHHAATKPNAIAAKDLANGGREATYGELAKRSTILASKLRGMGVGPGARVPLVVKRGIDMLVGIIAILACGAQYVPLDGGVVPDSTLRFVTGQAGGKNCTVLAIKSTRHRLDVCEVGQVVCIDDVHDQQSQQTLRPENHASPDGGCYVIYTSGTTGTPKGVNVTHKNVCNLLCLAPGNLGITSGIRVGQVLNVSFDMAAWEILGCLCNGGTLVLRGSDWLEALKQVDVLIATPSIVAKYEPHELPNIKTVATAGEPSSQRLADTWATSGTYYNCCGPTETTIVNTMHRHQAGEPLTIGKPTPNNNVYILDDNLRPVNAGEPGVMWAGGWGVSRGYINLPDKTAERYILDPFANDGSMMYNTGDIGRWTADGSIDILGRQDDQIKIKGFRVELDGVTSSLNSSTEVEQATALFIDNEIHAFVTPATCDTEKVKKHVKFSQPYYAVPSVFHALDALPLTANGKIDKRALKATLTTPVDEKELVKSVATVTEIEKPARTASNHGRKSSSSSMGTAVASESDCPSAATTLSVPDEKALEIDLEAGIPDKKMGKRSRGIRYRILIVYRRLFTIMGLLNIGAALGIIFSGFPREWLGILTALNLLLAVLARQDFVINALYTVACSLPRSWPLQIRKRAALIYHFGGVHSGAGVGAALWLLANNIGDAACMVTDKCSGTWGQQSVAGKVVSWLLTALFCAMLTMAYPTIRKKYHDSFESTHRFVGWTMLALFWVQVVLTANDTRQPSTTSLGKACVVSAPFWMLLVATFSVASSWFWLRKVRVEAETLSDHAVRLHFDYTVPVNGSFTRLSTAPLKEWHSFATIPAREPDSGRPAGYSLIVSNAGDWTKSCIKDGPNSIWVRGVPTCGVMRIATLFRRVVVIATGSGIGPLLGHLQNQSCPTQLIWSTPNPEKTFGSKLVNTIREKVPGAIIHNTKELGRPDLVKMGYNLAKGFNAEAVIIIANEKITKKVVYGLESRGMPAYGAIWDS